jgi:hypothetical protein
LLQNNAYVAMIFISELYGFCAAWDKKAQLKVDW